MVFSLSLAARASDDFQVRAALLLAVLSRLSVSNSSVLMRAFLLLILSAALAGAVRLYVRPALVVTVLAADILSSQQSPIDTIK